MRWISFVAYIVVGLVSSVWLTNAMNLYIDGWKAKRLLGQQLSSKVYLAERSGGQCTMKMISTFSKEEMEAVSRSADIMKTLENPNVVKYFGCNSDTSNVYIRMEYMEGGSVRSLMDNRQESLPESAIRDYTSQILDGLIYLHSKGVVHRHIHCGNILLDASKSKAKLDTTPQVTTGLNMYAGDVWNIGVTVLEMLMFERPIGPSLPLWKIPIEGQQWYRKLVENKVDQFSPDLKHFLLSIFVSLKEVPSAKKLASHPWLNPKLPKRLLSSLSIEEWILLALGLALVVWTCVRYHNGFCIAGWKIVKELGEGGYGIVYLVEKHGQRCAMKVIKGQKQEGGQSSHPEIEILQQLDHPNIVKLLGYSISATEIYIRLEYMQGGSIRDLLKAGKGRCLQETTACAFTADILAGLNHLHSREPRVIHHDIKSANILLDASLKTVKLADMGISKYQYCTTPEGFADRRLGTYHWMAPEVSIGRMAGRRSDMWSLGCTVYEMVTGDPPFLELTSKLLQTQAANKGSGPYRELVKSKGNMSQQLRDFLLCIFVDVKARPYTSAAAKHRWVTRMNSSHRTN